jgi:hypothetical protein
MRESLNLDQGRRGQLEEKLFEKVPSLKIWVNKWLEFIEELAKMRAMEESSQLDPEDEEKYLLSEEYYKYSLEYFDLLSQNDLKEDDMKRAEELRRKGAHPILRLIVNYFQGDDLAEALKLFDRLP